MVSLQDFVKTPKGHCYQIVDGKKVRISQQKYDEWITKLTVTKKRTPKASKKQTPLKRSSQQKSTQQQYVRFYDDSPENIADVITHGAIECIHVPRINTSLPRDMTYNDYVRTRGGWKLQGKDSDLLQVLDTLRSEQDMEEFSDSLTEAHMSELRQWVRKRPKGSCRVMFDFDRVINQVEGMIAGSLKTIQEQQLNISGLAKYHIGTKARWQAFRKTVDELLKQGASVSVVTNNPGCQDESFVAVLNFIHPAFTKENVHCSYRFANKLNCMSARKLVA